jgi:tetratricopeptide (TPR) repeat protein
MMRGDQMITYIRQSFYHFVHVKVLTVNMKWCDDIVELNAFAAILLQRNESAQAKRLLAQALRTIQPIFDAASKDKSSPQRISQGNVDLKWYTCCINFHSVVGQSQDLLERYEANPVFSRLFLVKGNNAAPTVQVMTAVLLYNIGLILHLESFQTGESSLLRRASEFYNGSLAILNTAVPMYPELALLIAALYHNLLHCHRALCDTEMARALAERLAQVLRWLETSWRCISLGDFEFFQSCLFFTRQHDLCHASAA